MEALLFMAAQMDRMDAQLALLAAALPPVQAIGHYDTSAHPLTQPQHPFIPNRDPLVINIDRLKDQGE